MKGAAMERMFNKQERAAQRKPGNGQGGSFASLTAGLMARKGEAVPAPAHLDGVSIHSHGVAREPQSVAEQNLAATIREQLISGAALQPQPAADPAPTFVEPQSSEPVEAFQAPQTPQSPEAPRSFKSPVSPEQGERSFEDQPAPVSEDVLRERAARRATAATGDCCALPLPTAVTEPLPPGPYAKVTTRLDKERVRKLKIIAARMGTSNQKVLLAALDHYLDYACDVLASECPCLARSMKEGL
jgi:hypothetical protein